MHELLLEESYIHSDETRVQVLNKPEKEATTQSYMWIYVSIKGSKHPTRIFDYRPTRTGYNPKGYLKEFSRYFITDAYAGYNRLEDVTNVYCWAHTRHKFSDSIPKDMDNVNNILPGITLKNSLTI